MEAKKDKIWALKSMLEADVCCIKIHHEILWHLNRQMHSSLPSPWCWKPERNRESRRKQTSSAVLLAASASLAEVQTGSCLQTRHPHRGQESTSRSFNMPGTARSLKTPENSWMLLIHLDTSWYILIPVWYLGTRYTPLSQRRFEEPALHQNQGVGRQGSKPKAQLNP